MAQEGIFITGERYDALSCAGEVLPTRKPRVGEYVYLPPDEKEHRIFQRNTMGHGLVQGTDYDVETEGVAHLPSKMNFRVRTALTLI